MTCLALMSEFVHIKLHICWILREFDMWKLSRKTKAKVPYNFIDYLYNVMYGKGVGGMGGDIYLNSLIESMPFATQLTSLESLLDRIYKNLCCSRQIFKISMPRTSRGPSGYSESFESDWKQQHTFDDYSWKWEV